MLDVPYAPSNRLVVKKMLEVAGVKDDEVVYDLGAGDGRIVIEAAEGFGAYGVGVEFHPDRFERLRENVARKELRERVEAIRADFKRVNVSNADVVTLYLYDDVNLKLAPRLERMLRPGARVVAHDYPVKCWVPDEVHKVKTGWRLHTIYLYKAPFKSKPLLPPPIVRKPL